ncbi:MAG: cyclic nucleotide-binding domain-containing protein [Burkholderiaceae bacterium]|nr:cyclic nucleotide-binding domain-containing protein [Burkholderiaceae bacterium]
MTAAFDFAVSPFDCLSGEQQQLVLRHLSIDAVPAGRVLLSPGEEPGHLFVLVSGHVQQWDGDELLASYGPDDCFDGRALVAGRASHRFVAAEAVQAWRLDKAVVGELIAANATFGALLFADLSQKLNALAERHGRHELQSLTMARVDQATVRPAEVVDAATDIVSVVRLFTAQRITNVLVRDASVTPPRLGIFTTAGLQRAILQGTPLDRLAVGALASHPLVTVRPSDHLFDALAVMIRHRVQRVVVVDAPEASAPDAQPRVVGILEQLDLLSFLSNHSYLVIRQILEATDLDALAAAAERITRVIALMHRSGTKVSLIARLVQELNAKLFERAWHLLAPADLVANSCLFVMGSEGRGEQLLKTDQDNGLVLRDGYTPPADLAAICDRFSQALARFGYPPCPGRIMVSNPDWRHSAAEFGHQVRRWLLLPSPDSLMALAIFVDAHAVSGDAALLAQVRGEVFTLVTDNDALLARFAAAINAFDGVATGEGGSGWWLRLFSGGKAQEPQDFDLKKAGLFPLVHGVRALALAERLRCTGTAERIEALVAAQRLPAVLGSELVDSLHFFMRLRLDAGLAAIEAGRPGAGIVMERLSSLDRDLLKDTLAVVKRFKAQLRLRFHLEAV